MKTAIRTTFAVLSFALTAAAHAATAPVSFRAVPPASVPEIDPSLAAGGLVLVTGGIAILRSRRARKTV